MVFSEGDIPRLSSRDVLLYAAQSLEAGFCSNSSPILIYAIYAAKTSLDFLLHHHILGHSIPHRLAHMTRAKTVTANFSDMPEAGTSRGLLDDEGDRCGSNTATLRDEAITINFAEDWTGLELAGSDKVMCSKGKRSNSASPHTEESRTSLPKDSSSARSGRKHLRIGTSQMKCAFRHLPGHCPFELACRAANATSASV